MPSWGTGLKQIIIIIIMSFIFHKSFTSYGNSHINNNKRNTAT
jgi:hypothetical protein